MVEAPFMCFDYRVMTPGRFELAITAVKGQCHSPLDQGAKKTASYDEVLYGITFLSDLPAYTLLSVIHLRAGLLRCRIPLLRCSNGFSGIRTRVILFLLKSAITN